MARRSTSEQEMPMKENPFLQAILDAPDDTPRLVYADWLDDYGDSDRAEFIRLQCMLDKKSTNDPQRTLLEARELELLGRHQEEWLGELRPLLSNWEFHRGFLNKVTVPAALLMGLTGHPWPATVHLIEADLTEFEVPHPVLDLVPESVARENVLLPLGLRGRTLVLAMRNLPDADILAKLQFILIRDVEAVAAPTEQIVEAIQRSYGRAEVESVTTACFIEPEVEFEADVMNDDAPVSRLVALIIAEAEALFADRVRIEPRLNSVQVYYQVGREWVERETPPRRLLDRIVARIRFLASLDASEDQVEQTGYMRGTDHRRSFDISVLIQRTKDGPSVLLTLLSRGADRSQEAT
jgi:uncharacterized protein (TIGR02996 family)